MRHAFALVSTMILGCSWAAVAGCSSDNATPAPDSGSSGSGSGSSSSSGSSSGSDSGGTDSGMGCAADGGASVPAKWDFAASAPALNGGKGQVLSVHVCDTIVWTNDDVGIMHSVVSTGGGFAFSTPAIAGTTAGVVLGSVQFPSAGTFTYDCGIHGNLMIGQVTVQ